MIRMIDSEINIAMAEDSQLSLISVQLVDFPKILAEYGDGIVDESVEDIIRYIDNNTHPKEIMVCRSDDYEFILCFYEGDRDSALELEERILRFSQQQKFPESKPVLSMNVNTWVAMYPDDGTNAVDLIDKISENCIYRATKAIS